MRAPLVVAAVLLLAAAGCGSDDDAGPAAVATEQAIELRDFAFAPSAVQAAAGTRVTVRLRNTGAAPHTFTASGVDETLQPGQEATTTVTVPSGPLPFYCRFHRERGMEGAFSATAGSAGPSDGSEAPDRY